MQNIGAQHGSPAYSWQQATPCRPWWTAVRGVAVTPSMEASDGAVHCPRGVGAAREWPSAWDHLSQHHPPAYQYLIPMASLGFAVTAAISLPTMVRLWREGRKVQGRRPAHPFYVLFVPFAPLAIALLKLIIVLAPRSYKVLGIPTAALEAGAFWAFLQLLLSFVSACTGDLATSLASLQPTRIWPCLCCWGPRAPNLRDVMAARVLVWQFMAVVVLIAFIELADDWAAEHKVVLSLTYLPSLALCVIAELSLIRYAHPLIGHRRCHMKFWTLKALFLANTFSLRIIGIVIRSDVRVGALCYTSELLVAAWSGAITAILAVPVACLAHCAFTPEDLREGERKSDPTAFNGRAEPELRPVEVLGDGLPSRGATHATV